MKIRLLIILAVCLCSLAIASAGFQSVEFDVQAEKAPTGSSFSNRPTGLKALYLIGEKLQVDVKRWVLPFQLLKGKPIGTLVSNLPAKEFTEAETASLQEWLDRGGRFIILFNEEWLDKNSYDLFLQMDERVEFWEVEQLLNNQGLQKSPEEGISWLISIFKHSDVVYFDDYHQGIENRRPFLLLLADFIRQPAGLFCLNGFIALLLWFFRYRLPIDRFRRYPEGEPENNLECSRVESLEKLFSKINSKEVAADIDHHFKGIITWKH